MGELKGSVKSLRVGAKDQVVGAKDQRVGAKDPRVGTKDLRADLFKDLVLNYWTVAVYGICPRQPPVKTGVVHTRLSTNNVAMWRDGHLEFYGKCALNY